MSDYTWIFVVSIIVAFIAAFGIGANDLANSFGSSVGTKALRMWQCVIIAGICEFLGAFFLGASVTDTIKSGITNVNYFKPYPQLFLYGFFAVLCAAVREGGWKIPLNFVPACEISPNNCRRLSVSHHLWYPGVLGQLCQLPGAARIDHAYNRYAICSMSSLPLMYLTLSNVFTPRVSRYSPAHPPTPQRTVGAIIGMSLVIGGGDAVVWSASSSTFPYFKGFAAVVTSWFLSPIAAFIIVSIVWIFMRPVMRSKHSFIISFWLLPLFVTATISLITAFIIQVGGKNGTWDAQSDGTIAWICITVGVGCGLITLIVFMPFIKKRAISDEAKLQERYERDVAMSKG